MSLILTDHFTIYVTKTIFASKNYLCHPGFSTNQQKPANHSQQ